MILVPKVIQALHDRLVLRAIPGQKATREIKVIPECRVTKVNKEIKETLE